MARVTYDPFTLALIDSTCSVPYFLPAFSSQALDASFSSAPRGRLLYVTPERVSRSPAFLARLRQAYNAGRLAAFVVDEAHCCSQARPIRSVNQSPPKISHQFLCGGLRTL